MSSFPSLLLLFEERDDEDELELLPDRSSLALLSFPCALARLNARQHSSIESVIFDFIEFGVNDPDFIKKSAKDFCASSNLS